MKTTLLAGITALLAASTSAYATVLDDQRRLDKLENTCRGAGGPTSETDKACDAVDKLAKDLQARGYCVYGHGVIGIKGKGDHCYTIKALNRPY